VGGGGRRREGGHEGGMRSFCFGLVCSLGRPTAAPPSPAVERDVVPSWIRGANRFCRVMYCTASSLSGGLVHVRSCLSACCGDGSASLPAQSSSGRSYRRVGRRRGAC